jgi:hypothetical protein
MKSPGIELQADDSEYNDRKQHQQSDLQQRRHCFDDGLQHHLQTYIGKWALATAWDFVILRCFFSAISSGSTGIESQGAFEQRLDALQSLNAHLQALFVGNALSDL